MHNLREKLQKSGKWVNPYIIKSENLAERILINDSDQLTPEHGQRLQSLLKRTLPKSILVELGSGSGQHLLRLAQQNPDSLVFGFELKFKRAVRTIEKSEQAGLKNVYLLRTNSNNLENLFPNQSIDALFINFPDPWDKQRWHKHRIIREDSLQIFANKLVKNGQLKLKTDHHGYFTDTLALIKASSEYQTYFQTKDLHQSERAASNILTEFEQLFMSQGLPVYAVEALRV